MKIILIDKNNRILVDDHWNWDIIVDNSIRVEANKEWIIIQLLKDYGTIWDIEITITDDWEIWYLTDSDET